MKMTITSPSRWMGIATLLTLLVTLGCSESGAPPTDSDSHQVSGDSAFVGVSVVDVEAGRILEDRTVVVNDGVITTIGPAGDIELAPDVARIDGSGQFLLPGLSDMHAHTIFEDSLALYLANGVTLVRNMWGSPETLALREAVAEGRIPGPRIVTAGALLDGAPKIWSGSTEVTDAGQARELVAQQASDGYDFVKIYSRITPEVFEAIAAAARENGIEFSGHVPQDVPFTRAIESGMRTSEHFLGALFGVLANSSLPNPDMAAFDDRSHEFIIALGKGEIDADTLVDPEKVDHLAAKLAEADHWLVPTHDIMKNFTSIERPMHEEALRYAAPADRELARMLEENPAVWAMPPKIIAGEDVLYRVRSQLLGDLHRGGTKILVGTDDSLQHGFAVVDEMRALEAVGMSRADVLQAATAEAAAYLGLEGELGVVAEGAAADLVLMDDNPLDNLEALRDPAGVMRAGTWYTRSQLDAMLEEIAEETAAIEAEFAGAPAFGPDAGAVADFLSDEHGAVRMAMAESDEGTFITAAIRPESDWTTYTMTPQAGAISVDAGNGPVIATRKTDRGWQLVVGDTPVGSPVPGAVSAILTRTPVDILVLDAVGRGLTPDETLEIAAWDCGPELDCENAEAQSLTVTNLGPDPILGHRMYEATQAFRVQATEAETGLIEYWIAAPGLFSGGPVRIDFAGIRDWRRIK